MHRTAASLGQVYKGRLKETGEIVAVKVQRPFVLETVTIDLFIIRNLGLVLRRFPQVRFSSTWGELAEILPLIIRTETLLNTVRYPLMLLAW